MATIMDDTIMTMDGDAVMGGPTTPAAPSAIIRITK